MEKETLELSKHTLEMMEKLAKKLGCTAEQAWPHVVQYEFSRGITALVMLFVTLCTGAILAYLSRRLMTYPDRCKGLSPNEMDTYRCIGGLVLFLVVLLTGVGVAGLVYEAIPRLVNPTGAAIVHILTGS